MGTGELSQGARAGPYGETVTRSKSNLDNVPLTPSPCHICTSKNAIKLLEYVGFPSEVIENAQKGYLN